jgi:flavodoxin
MRKTLIAFHSRTGHTRRVAQALARRLDADLEEIRIVQPMGGAVGYALCALEAITALTPALRPSRRQVSDYELVVIGTPVWFWRLASPVRSWLAQHRLEGRVAFFCTMGGSGAPRVFRAMEQLARCKPVATLALTEAQLDRSDGLLDAFADRLRAGSTSKLVRVSRARPTGTGARRAA